MEGVEQKLDSQTKTSCFNSSDDSHEFPNNAYVGQAIGGGDCFFDSVAQGLNQLKPEIFFSVKSLREVCKRFAQSQLKNDQSWLEEALRNEAETISLYAPRIEFTAYDIEQRSESVNVLGLIAPIWGRSDIEGRIICEEYNIQLHVIEKCVVDESELLLHQIVNSEGSRSVDPLNHNEVNTIHIINKGQSHFEPVLSTPRIKFRRFDSDEGRVNNADLFTAIREGNNDKAKSLLEHGVKTHIIDRNNKNNSPLHYAVEKEQKEIVEELLNPRWKTNVNFQNNQGNTPLHIATLKDNKDLVELLLNNQAEVSVQNKSEKTPFDIAETHDTPNGQEIVNILAGHLKIEILSNQQKEVRDKLEGFVEDFVSIYECSLSEYYERLENHVAKPGKFADFANKVIEIGKGGTEGIEVAGIKATSLMGINALQNILSGIGSWHNRKELKKLLGQLFHFKKDPDGVREVLVKSAVDIFRSFESQFVQVTADGQWHRAMTKLAEDAVCRVINYCKENTIDKFSTISITKGIVLGESKQYQYTSSGMPHITKGHTLENNKSKSWNTAELFEKPGLITIQSDGTADAYYKRKSRKSDTSNYGYRLLLKWESEDEVRLSMEYQEKLTGREYKYVLKLDEIAYLETVLLDKINNQDPKLMEKRINEGFKAVMEQIKQEAGNSFNELEKYISDNFDKLSNYIENHKNEIKELFNRAFQQHEAIVRGNKDEHKKTQAAVENANEGINNLQKGQADIITEIRTLGRTDKIKQPIWFEIKDNVKPFIGRAAQLNEITAALQRGKYVVINGLPGVGKSELAIKYARSRYDRNDSVIWVDTETAKESFHRLYKRLGFKAKDEDGDDKSVKSIVEDLYAYFSEWKSLFIFVNAERYALIKEFLPISLPSDTNKPDVLITSSNKLEWEERGNFIVLPSLGDFTDAEGLEFVKDFLEIKDDSQNHDILELVNKLHNFPLVLQQAVAYIKRTIETYQKRNWVFKVSDYIKNYEETPKTMLSITCKALQVTLATIRNEEYGQQSLIMLNIISYLASSNIPEDMFLSELASGDQDKLISITRLLENYSIVRLEQGMISVHGLVQQVRRLEIVEPNEEGLVLEEATLAKALMLLKGNMKNSAEHYLSHVTSAWNYASKYDKLIECFIVDNIDDKEAYTTYFHLIAESSSYEIVEAIINKVQQNYSNKLKEVINARDKDRGKPLHNAALSGDARIVKLLIEKGAIVNVKRKHNWTPLHLAAKNGYLEVVKMFLDNDAEISARTGYKFTSLHLASRNGFSEVVRLLLDKGADVNAEDRHEYTPLHFAVKKNHFAVVQTLLEDDKINVNAETKFKVTALHFAAREGYKNTIKVLLEKGANVNTTNIGGFTPLHFAVLSDNTEVVNELLKKGEIDVNAQTTEGNTPLHLAAETGNLEVVEALIARKANIDVKNKEGKVASELADDKNHQYIKNYIIQIQNKSEVFASLVNPNQQIAYIKTPGTSGIGGQLYEIELSMLFLLQGVTRKEDEKIHSFYLATNMKEAGDFDDVVFKYRYIDDRVEKSNIVFLQAKHRESEKNEKEKEKKISIDTLLSQSEKGDFLLRKYLSSYRKVKQLLLKPDHLMSIDGIDRCDFVIYTNAVFNFDKIGNSGIKEYVEECHVEPGDILNLKEDSKKYYKLNSGVKVMDALRHSLDYEILAKELAQSSSSGSVDGNKSIFKDYQFSLAERVIEKINQREGKLREEFLNGDLDIEFSSGFFDAIKKKQEFAKKSLIELKEQLKEKKIQLPNNFGSAEKNDLKLPLPKKLISDDEIKEFLSVLKLFVSQPNESQLGEIIKQKIQSIYRVEQNDIDSVFSDVEYKVRKWWRETEGYEYLTEKNTFFQESARVSFNFDVKEPVALFTGRIEKLKDLHKILQDGGDAVISQMASVTGLGGIGKSELARKYISEYSKDYDNNVIWINADNYLSIAESFRRLAQSKLKISTVDENGQEKEIKQIVENVYSFFAKRHRKSLFIFDNAGKHKAYGERDEGIDTFLPSGFNKPHILITSRDQEWGDIKPLSLGVFTEEEAIEFIQKALREIGPQKNEMKELAGKLQRLPLALTQAVAYIKMENKRLKSIGETFSIKSYLDKYAQKVKDLLNLKLNEEFGQYTESVFTTWAVTTDKINEEICGGEALKILDVLAYLASDKIPVEIFLELITDERQRNARLRRAVELLDQYSMVDLGVRVLNIHRLVQQVTRINLEEQNKETLVLRETLTLLEKPMADTQSSTGSTYTSHAISAWGYTSKHNELVQKFSKLPGHIIDKLDDGVRYEEACLFGTEALELLKRVLGSDHSDILRVMNIRAGVFSKRGNYNEALTAFEELSRKSQQILGLHDPYTLLAENNIAVVLDHQGKYNAALKAHERVLDERRHILGHNHYDTLMTENNIAIVLQKQGEYEKALKIYREVLDKLKRTLGNENLDTLMVANSTAILLKTLGQYDEALQIYEQVLDKRKEILGENHPDTLLTMHGIAVVFDKQEEHDKALDGYQKVLEKRKVVLGDNHPDTLGTESNIAGILFDKREYEKALKVNQEVQEKRNQILGYNHPDTLTTMHNIALVLECQNKDDEALEAYQKVFDKRKEILGDNHPDTLMTETNMAGILFDKGERVRAFGIYQRVLGEFELIFGYDHPSTETMRRLASTAHATLFTLHNASASGNLNKVRELIEEGADVNAKDTSGATPLHVAVKASFQEVVDLLLAGHADPDIRDTNGETPLVLVLEKLAKGGTGDQSNLEIIEILLRTKTDESIESSLCRAITSGKLDVVRYLITIGADTNTRNGDHDTPLHLAVDGGYPSIVGILLESKADPNIQDKNRKTPLDLAQEKLVQDPENDDFQTITGLLLSLTDAF